MKFKPHHVALTVNNTQESKNWYQEKLGFEVIHEYNKHGMEITLLKLEDVRLELFCYGKDTRALPNDRKDLTDDLHVIGTKHLCIEVEDLEFTIEELKAKGVTFVMDLDTAGFGGRYTFFKDCNEILIELYQAERI